MKWISTAIAGSIWLAAARIMAQSADLEPLGVGLAAGSTYVTNAPNPLVTVFLGARNSGSGQTTGGTYFDRLYLSTNATWEATDVVIGGFYAFPTTTNVPAGATYWRTNTLSLPVTASGTYYLILRVDEDNTVPEASNANNTLIVPFTYNLVPPDLAPVRVGLDVGAILTTNRPNPYVSVYYTVTNLGAAASTRTYFDRLYLSTNSTLDASDPVIGGFYLNHVSTNVPPGIGYWRTNAFSLPVTTSGTYYLIAQSDADASVYEGEEANNVLAVPFTFVLSAPDLLPSTLGLAVGPVLTTNRPNPYVSVYFAITNSGTAESSVAFFDRLYLSTNATLDATDSVIGGFYLNHTSTNIPAGVEYWRTNALSLPVYSNGTYYLIVQADADASVFETNNANNTLVVPFTFNLAPPNILPVTVGLAVGPTLNTNRPNPYVSLHFAITNAGAAESTVPFFDRVYLSTNATWDASDPVVAGYYANHTSTNVSASASYWRTNAAPLPISTSGTYYLIVRADADLAVYEDIETDNTIVVPFAFQLVPPDLFASALVLPGGTNLPSNSPNPNVTVAFNVANSGAAASTVGYFDRLYFSTNATWESSDPVLGGFYLDHTPTNLMSGASYWRTNLITLPVSSPGAYYIILRADADNSVYEDQKANNTLVVPFSFGSVPPAGHRFTGVRVEPGGVVMLTLTGTLGVQYRLESSPDMANWTASTTFTCTSSPMTIQDPAVLGTGPKYYRLTRL